MRKILLIILALSLLAFAAGRTTATREGDNTYTGINIFSGLCSGSCSLTLKALIDPDDSYESHVTINSTISTPDPVHDYSRGIRVKMTANPSATDTDLDLGAGTFQTMTRGAYAVGGDNSMLGTSEHYGTNNKAYGQGATGLCTNFSSGSITDCIGGAFAAGSPAGSITNAYGGQFHILPQAGTIGNGYGVFVRTPTVTTGSIANMYGVYVEDQNVATTTSRAIKTGRGFVEFGDALQLSTTTSQPTCNSTNRGAFWIIRGGNGVADTLQVCMKNNADAYAWVTK